MPNAVLFSSATSNTPRADTVNEAGGPAYRMPAKMALAQLAATGCFNGTYYVSGSEQLGAVKTLVDQVADQSFVAKLAVYAREKAAMKDMPAALLLLVRDPSLFAKAFPRVVDNGKMLRTFTQMLRSGQFGRKSMSYQIKRLVGRWLNDASPIALLNTLGDKPSIRDILRLARPKPKDEERRALFGWLAEKPQVGTIGGVHLGVEPQFKTNWLSESLPPEAKAIAAYRAAESEADQTEALDQLPDGSSLRWDLFASEAKGAFTWLRLMRMMGPQALRMNLNTLQRHGVLASEEIMQYVAGRLADPEEVKRSRQFPYQYFAAYLNAASEVPQRIKSALHRAAELACGNVPALPGPVVIGVDVSGSMHSPVTGDRGYGATSKVECIDVAALFGAAILRKNPDSLLVPFSNKPHSFEGDPADTILSIAKRLRQFSGGTDCSIPLRVANELKDARRFVGAVIVSDNESWIGLGRRGSTQLVSQWEAFRLKHPGSKLVCIDLQPNTTTQAPERENILNVGGWNDAVFSVVAGFFSGGPERFVREVEAVEL